MNSKEFSVGNFSPNLTLPFLLVNHCPKLAIKRLTYPPEIEGSYPD